MKHGVSVGVLVATVLATACLGGDNGPVAPNATEPFDVTVTNRTAADGEPFPVSVVTAGPGQLTVKVTRHALCGTIVHAFVFRATTEIDIVTHVSSDPAANCGTIPANAVVDYEGTITAVVPARYNVRLFEGEGDAAPKLLGSGVITVPAGP